MANMSGELYLVIERSSPLPDLLETLDPLEITTGIHSVMEGLSFLHEQVINILSVLVKMWLYQ